MAEPLIHTHARTQHTTQKLSSHFHFPERRMGVVKEFICFNFVYQNIEFINNTWEG